MLNDFLKVWANGLWILLNVESGGVVAHRRCSHTHHLPKGLRYLCSHTVVSDFCGDIEAIVSSTRCWSLLWYIIGFIDPKFLELDSKRRSLVWVTNECCGDVLLGGTIQWGHDIGCICWFLSADVQGKCRLHTTMPRQLYVCPSLAVVLLIEVVVGFRLVKYAFYRMHLVK